MEEAIIGVRILFPVTRRYRASNGATALLFPGITTSADSNVYRDDNQIASLACDITEYKLRRLECGTKKIIGRLRRAAVNNTS